MPSVEAAPTFDLGLSVDEAYAAIPHRRTRIELARSDIATPDKDYLKLAFHLIDQAILLRVTAFRQFYRGDTEDARLLAKMDQVSDFLRTVEPPARLTNYHQQLLEALSAQRAFFQDWQAQGRQFAYGTPSSLASHPSVQKASGALKAAYQTLMQNYPGEDPHNQAAFFDYHCALDFL